MEILFLFLVLNPACEVDFFSSSFCFFLAGSAILSKNVVCVVVLTFIRGIFFSLHGNIRGGGGGGAPAAIKLWSNISSHLPAYKYKPCKCIIISLLPKYRFLRGNFVQVNISCSVAINHESR